MSIMWLLKGEFHSVCRSLFRLPVGHWQLRDVVGLSCGTLSSSVTTQPVQPD